MFFSQQILLFFWPKSWEIFGMFFLLQIPVILLFKKKSPNFWYNKIGGKKHPAQNRPQKKYKLKSYIIKKKESGKKKTKGSLGTWTSIFRCERQVCKFAWLLHSLSHKAHRRPRETLLLQVLGLALPFTRLSKLFFILGQNHFAEPNQHVLTFFHLI